MSSSTTPTMIMIPAPEISSGTEPIPEVWNTKLIAIGEIAINAKNNAPKNVNLLEIFAM